MKRNNIFMWAYIVAIILCVIRRTNQAFSAWEPMVLAVTVSSIFFSFEDLAKSVGHALEDSYQYTNQYANEITKSLEEEMRVLSRITQKLGHISASEDRKNRLQLMQKTISSTMEVILLQTNKHEKRSSMINQILAIYQWFIMLFAFLGFLSIFLILFFSDKIQFSVISQEQVTVLSFAIILITQQINQFVSDNIEKHNKEFSKLIDKHGESIREARELEDMADCLINKRKPLDREATANAD